MSSDCKYFAMCAVSASLALGCNLLDEDAAEKEEKCHDACDTWHDCMQDFMDTLGCEFTDGKNDAVDECSDDCVDAFEDVDDDDVEDVLDCFDCIGDMACSELFQSEEMPCPDECDHSGFEDWDDASNYEPDTHGESPECDGLFNY